MSAFPTLLALVLVLLATRCEASNTNNTIISTSTTFVAPTHRTTHALTLTTQVTHAAVLHYAAVLSGHAPLSARQIKRAAQRCASETTCPSKEVPRSCASGEEVEDDSDDYGIAFADTVHAHAAAEVEVVLCGLQSNTSYDVYVVAEDSPHGCLDTFDGSVVAIKGTVTHAQPPVVKLDAAAAVNASTTAISLGFTLSTPGVLFIAVQAVNESEPALLKSNEVMMQHDLGVDVRFFKATRLHPRDLTVSWTVESLVPATDFHVYYGAEALGHPGFYTSVSWSAWAATTHAPAPDIRNLSCTPRDASTTEMDISFALHFDPVVDMKRVVEADAMLNYAYRLHYTMAEIIGNAPNGHHAADMTEEEEDGPSDQPVAIQSSSSSTGDEPARLQGWFNFGTFPTIDRLAHAMATKVHTRTLSHLPQDSEYEITLYAETLYSFGVVGQRARVSSCRTHARAPKITRATRDDESVSVRLSGPANVYYLIAPRVVVESASSSYSQATSVAMLTQMLLQADRAMDEPRHLHVGVFVVSSIEPGGVEQPYVDGTVPIHGIFPPSEYTIVLITETIASGGVFGVPQLASYVTPPRR